MVVSQFIYRVAIRGCLWITLFYNKQVYNIKDDFSTEIYRTLNNLFCFKRKLQCLKKIIFVIDEILYLLSLPQEPNDLLLGISTLPHARNSPIIDGRTNFTLARYKGSRSPQRA
ncbi:MAG: hypothetical protein A2W74_09945 [Planctomycetes bacterium RIFCSPLOWO2_12_38_17]|nr:MAG: hypothetical protein A2W74_09945 [Planctomycetes bacterium RIFCSPLOWO2_12_38_17]